MTNVKNQGNIYTPSYSNRSNNFIEKFTHSVKCELQNSKTVVMSLALVFSELGPVFHRMFESQIVTVEILLKITIGVTPAVSTSLNTRPTWSVLG